MKRECLIIEKILMTGDISLDPLAAEHLESCAECKGFQRGLSQAKRPSSASLFDRYDEEIRVLLLLVRPLLGLLLLLLGFIVLGRITTLGEIFILISIFLLAISMQFKAFGPLLGKNFWVLLLLAIVIGLGINIIGGSMARIDNGRRRRFVKPPELKAPALGRVDNPVVDGNQ